MNSLYTTTITDEARRRGIRVAVIDPVAPIFVLSHGGRRVRCYNALTDRVGAVTFHMAQNKRLANAFLAGRGFPVPAQIPAGDREAARRFLRTYGRVVVKPCTQWGGRGVSVAVRSERELAEALKRARRFEEEVVIEQCVRGDDYRLIFVNYRYVAAILRRPARVIGNGRDTVRTLIRDRNRQERRRDPSHMIPLDAETGRNLAALGLSWDTVPAKGRAVQVRLTSNYHTGGEVDIVTDQVPRALVREAARIARSLGAPMVGIDFLVDARRGRHWVIELSPDMAISPPEGELVARRFLDDLFPETRATAPISPPGPGTPPGWRRYDGNCPTRRRSS
jgi:D-alanine-D-alanine ligase-like ATP-grasp enzyme